MRGSVSPCEYDRVVDGDEGEGEDDNVVDGDEGEGEDI